MQVKITTSQLREQRNAAIVSGLPIRLHDTELKGFGCYITAKGEVSWVLQRWIGGRDGRPIRTVIGHMGSMSIDEARQQARIDLGKIAGGEDVSLRKKKRLAEQKKVAKAETLGELFNTYLAQRIKEDQNNNNNNNTKSRYWTEAKRQFDRHVTPTIDAKTLIIHITKADIRALMDALHNKASAQRYVFAFLRPFFKWAVERDHIEASPMTDLKPPKPAKERDRVLTDNELAAIWRACEKMGYPYGKCIQLLILLAQREDELAGMQWSEIDFEKQQWHIPPERTKTENAHIVSLSQLAIDILKSIPQRAEHVFYTRQAETSKLQGFGKAKNVLDLLISNPNMLLEEARQLANLPKRQFRYKIKGKAWRLHDIRRSAATGMAALKHPPHVIEKILNHAIASKVERIYNRFEYLDERKAALNDWSAHIKTITAL